MQLLTPSQLAERSGIPDDEVIMVLEERGIRSEMRRDAKNVLRPHYPDTCIKILHMFRGRVCQPDAACGLADLSEVADELGLTNMEAYGRLVAQGHVPEERVDSAGPRICFDRKALSHA